MNINNYDAPEWAIELVTEVCKDYHRALPATFSWIDGKTSHWSSGWTKTKELHLHSGTDQYDAELVLLHELAHHLLNKTKKGQRQGHTKKFWNLAFELYDKYGIDLAYAYYREEHYKVKATNAYTKLMATKPKA